MFGYEWNCDSVMVLSFVMYLVGVFEFVSGLKWIVCCFEVGIVCIFL